MAKPYLEPAMNKAFGDGALISEMLKESLEKALRTPSLWTSMPRTPATGVLHDWAKPSFTFGTILRRSPVRGEIPEDENLLVMVTSPNEGIVIRGNAYTKPGDTGILKGSDWEVIEE